MLWCWPTVDTEKYKFYIICNIAYVRKAYNMMVHENNMNCWSNKFTEILYRFYLKEYWLSQNVCNEVSFLNKQRLVEAIVINDGLKLYKQEKVITWIEVFNHADKKELYLNVIDFTIYRKCLSRFRTFFCLFQLFYFLSCTINCMTALAQNVFSHHTFKILSWLYSCLFDISQFHILYFCSNTCHQV